MKYYYFLLVSSACFLLLGCGSRRSSEIVFPLCDTLFAVSEFVPEGTAFLKPEEIWAEDSLILLMTYREEHFFHLYARNGKHLRSFGRYGEGPEDFLAPVSMEVSDGVLKVYDNFRFRYMSCPMAEIMDENREVVFDKREVPVFVENITECRPDTFFFLGGTERLIGCLQGNDTLSCIDYPQEYLSYSPMARHLLFQGTMKQHPAHDKLLFAASRFAYLHFFTVSADGNLKSLKCHFSGKPLFKDVSGGDVYAVSLEKDNKSGYNAVSVTSDYVYALYNGRASTDSRSYFGNRIFVFDWEGNPVREWVLDEDAWKIYVDEQNHWLYTISYGDLTKNDTVRYYIYDLHCCR